MTKFSLGIYILRNGKLAEVLAIREERIIGIYCLNNSVMSWDLEGLYSYREHGELDLIEKFRSIAGGYVNIYIPKITEQRINGLPIISGIYHSLGSAEYYFIEEKNIKLACRKIKFDGFNIMDITDDKN